MKKSELGKVSVNDALKGLIVAIITAFITALYNVIQTGGAIEFTWVFFKPILMVSLAAGLSYIIKNWLTNSNDKFLKSE